MSGPIKPSEVGTAIAASFPEQVFEAFNELIASNWSMTGATVRQGEVVKRIVQKLDCDVHEVFERGWLNVEEAYRKEGWHVEYDKPGYNETYEPTFRFDRKASP